MIDTPKTNDQTTETTDQFHLRIKRQIEAIEAKKFRCPNPSSIEVFDFDKNWHLVLPRLHDAKVERVLSNGMNRWLNNNRIPRKGSERYDPKAGPWSYTPSDYWLMEVDRRAESTKSDVDWEILSDNPTTEEEWEKYYREVEKEERFRSQFEPKPDTVDWYRAVHGCHWLAPWLREIGQRVYPQYKCRILSGDDHSLAYSADRTGNIRVIFDILNYREMSAMELIEFATRKGTEPETECALSC